MSEQKNNDVKKETGIDVNVVTFDENGEVVGLDEQTLDEVAGGLDSNNGCGNSANISC